jgi:hypothetical protein
MAGIFVCYRNVDSGWAVLLDRELSSRFGPAHVFRSSRSIRPGEDFPDRILQGIRESWVVLVIIGRGWSARTGHNGHHHLDAKQDWVRREIAYAFRARIAVVPVLIDGTQPPTAEDLPADIVRLARCQYLRLHEHNDQHDIDNLIAKLGDLAPQQTSSATDGQNDAQTVRTLCGI